MMIFFYAIMTGCLVVTSADLAAVAQYQTGYTHLGLLALAMISLGVATIPWAKVYKLMDEKGKKEYSNGN